MKVRPALMVALLFWLAAGLCLADGQPANAQDNNPPNPPTGPALSDPGMPPGGCPLDSGVRPFGRMFAQGPGQGPRGGFGGRHGDDWSDRRQHLEQLRILKMLEALNLSEDQEMEFLTAFRSVRKKHGELNAEKETLVDSLSVMLDQEKVSRKGVDDVIDRILKIEDSKRDVMHDFVSKIRDLLTPEQLARFVVFNERFERELLEQVKSFRERRGGFRPGPPSPEGEG